MYTTGTDITSASDWTVGMLAGTGTLGIEEGSDSTAKLRYPPVDPSGTVFFSAQYYLGRADCIAPAVLY